MEWCFGCWHHLACPQKISFSRATWRTPFMRACQLEQHETENNCHPHEHRSGNTTRSCGLSVPYMLCCCRKEALFNHFLSVLWDMQRATKWDLCLSAVNGKSSFSSLGSQLDHSLTLFNTAEVVVMPGWWCQSVCLSTVWKRDRNYLLSTTGLIATSNVHIFPQCCSPTSLSGWNGKSYRVHLTLHAHVPQVTVRNSCIPKGQDQQPNAGRQISRTTREIWKFCKVE